MLCTCMHIAIPIWPCLCPLGYPYKAYFYQALVCNSHYAYSTTYFVMTFVTKLYDSPISLYTLDDIVIIISPLCLQVTNLISLFTHSSSHTRSPEVLSHFSKNSMSLSLLLCCLLADSVHCFFVHAFVVCILTLKKFLIAFVC